jgi:dCTP deaminase
MILSDRDLSAAINDRRLIIEPPPSPDQIKSTTIDLRVGEDFVRWKAQPTSFDGVVDLDTVDLDDYGDLVEPVEPHRGKILIAPKDFVLVPTREWVELPPQSKLAARVEGRSTLARLGMTIHNTAPTIHAGFRGRIVLEICNHGIFTLKVTPNTTRLCQLIVEKVSSQPAMGVMNRFLDQIKAVAEGIRKAPYVPSNFGPFVEADRFAPPSAMIGMAEKSVL